jgi:signal transduction histidine kinase
MSVRLRLALTVLLTGLATALGVIVAVGLAFERFERETAWARADDFLARVVALHGDLLDQHQRAPEEFTLFLRSLLLFERDTQLYLLAPDGRVLAHSIEMPLPPDLRVKIAPVQEAAAVASDPARRVSRSAAYVMGDDPAYMDADAVVAARALRRASIQPAPEVAGFLYVVGRKPGLPAGRLARFGAALAGPALGPVLAVIVLATALAVWVIGAVTMPLRVLSDEVAEATRRGFDAAQTMLPSNPQLEAAVGDDEFGRLRSGFATLMQRLSAQWGELRRLDQFRRESVSNLSHDLRSPLTAAVAGLETLQRRLGDDALRAEDRRLVEVALRNTQSAARLVRSLGDLALLDEAEFRLQVMRVDLAELLDDIALRFSPRAQGGGVALDFVPAGDGPLPADVDIELFERAVANLLDNALKHTGPGGFIRLRAASSGAALTIEVSDSGSGVPASELPHLFDRHFQGRNQGQGQGGRAEGGKGLGLAIVKRIVELHRGGVVAESQPGHGTTVRINLPLPAA